MTRKGIVLAGGTGSRLHPLTLAVSKQLMPVYDKPLVYYPLCTLMAADIRDILVITTPQDRESFQRLLGDGSQWGISITYAEQPRPEGIAQALLVGADFIGGEPVALILGDNLFHGHGLADLLQRAALQSQGATIFACHVNDPERYGVVGFDAAGHAESLDEKPAVPRSNFAVTGLYFYDRDAVDLARTLTPSARGELEITDLNRLYLDRGDLRVERMEPGLTWLDTGTHESLLAAANFIHVMQTRQGLLIGSPDVVALSNGWIDRSQVEAMARRCASGSYGRYLQALLARRNDE
ncbi:MAG TPA: glucose-1-phosphate thymidylyltransferase RfbA [Moraxellaceae bacterium]|nr:glucose-1-phosphate thymidylyltransferase RfbA [Moraxellaceae bacterium]